MGILKFSVILMCMFTNNVYLFHVYDDDFLYNCMDDGSNPILYINGH